MNHYLINNEIRAIEEGQEFLVKSDWVLLSDEELHARLNPAKTEAQIKAEAKAEIARQLEVLTVTTSYGNIFDANAQAKLDMQNGIEAARTTKELIDLGLLPADTVWDSIKWRLANDTEIVITLLELKEASMLAIKKYAEVKGIVQ